MRAVSVRVSGVCCWSSECAGEESGILDRRYAPVTATPVDASMLNAYGVCVCGVYDTCERARGDTQARRGDCTVVRALDDGDRLARMYAVGINAVPLQVPYALDLVGELGFRA
jgi:hypothetical protein